MKLMGDEIRETMGKRHITVLLGGHYKDFGFYSGVRWDNGELGAVMRHLT